MNYDVIIPISDRTSTILPIAIDSIKKHLQGVKAVKLIGRSDLERFAIDLGCCFVDEDKLYSGLTYKALDDLILLRNITSDRTGWYFQQFLKMAYSLSCDDEYYLVWDADLVLLNKLEMFDPDKHPYFDLKTEYHKPYFSTINRLFGYRTIERKRNISFIAEHMLIKSDYMRSMINDICNNHELKGDLFFEKIISAIRGVDIPGSGFSEFETYGNYVDNKFPETYTFRRNKTLREGELFLGNNPSSVYLDWAAKSFDLINFECRKEMIEDLKNNIEEIMKKKSLYEVAMEHSNLIEYW